MEYFSHSLVAACGLIFRLDPEVYRIVWTSLQISLTATALVAVFAVPLGLFVGMLEFRGKALLHYLLNTLTAMPTVMIGLVLYGLLGRRGPLGELGLLYSPGAVIVGECFLILPIVLSLSAGAVQAADPRLLNTVRSLGANPLQQLLLVFREIRTALFAAVVLGFGRAIGEVGAAMMLGGNIQGFTRTMTTAIALETSKGEFELALALGLLLLVIAFAVNMVFLSLQGGLRRG